MPLSRQALDVLAEASKATRGALVFPGSRPGAMMGNTVMTPALRTAGVGARLPVELQGPGAAARRGRAPFRVRAGARRGLGDVAAYARDDLLEKRRPVMQRWADCISG